jgi:hypothetical protein
MTERQPVKTTNLDIYGDDVLPWSRAHDALTNEHGPDVTHFLGTVGPDGSPHSAGVGAVWVDGDFYVVAGPDTRKARNLAANPACTISARLTGIDLVVEGEAVRVVDAPTLERIAAVYRDGGWPAEVEGEAFTAPFSAPSAGPPPWHLHRMQPRKMFGVATAEPYGATRWQFES